jgi:L-ascorbate metabolism protein UlaG (beta-lactamase superfamily)
MNFRIDRIAGRVMPVNAFLVHGPDGLVVVDGMLTISDAALVRQAIDEADVPLAGVVITHPHPDHYAGLWHLIGDDDVPILATRAVDEVIRRDDALKNEVVGPMMGAEWPTTRRFPTHLVDSGDAVQSSAPASPTSTASGASIPSRCSPATSSTTACTPTSPMGTGNSGWQPCPASNGSYRPM